MQSNNDVSSRAFQTLHRMAFKYSGSVPSLTAMFWYSCREDAINSGQPNVASWEAATLVIGLVEIGISLLFI